MTQIEPTETKRIEHQVREDLERSLHAVSPDIRRQLAGARQTAMASVSDASGWSMPWPAVLASAATIVLAVLLWVVSPWDFSSDGTPDVSDNVVAPKVSGETDDFLMALELASLDDESLDVVADLEFYLWLSEEKLPDV